MRSKNPRYIRHKLHVGFQLRCPNCEMGDMFPNSLFKLTETCAYCDCRFERRSSEAIAASYLNVAVAEFTSLIGFLTLQILFEPPLLVQLLIWIPYIMIFTAVFYRHARGVWIAIMFLFGYIYPDPDYTREYIAPAHVSQGRTPETFE